jgi:hypothetical protein
VLRLIEEAALFTGTMSWGWSTTIVSPPDGDMADYMRSLELLLRREDGIYYPTHGPKCGAQGACAGADRHRRMREAQILGQLQARRDDREHGRALYTDTIRRLHPAAASVLAISRSSGARAVVHRRRPMEAGGMMKWQRVGLVRQRAGDAALIVPALLCFFWRSVGSAAGSPPPPVSIAQASLQSMREQQRLTTLSARYVAVVTSRQERGVLTPEKTMIMQGDVRYEVNLAALTQDSLRWDEATKTLSVTLPPIEISEPQVDLKTIQEYDNGSLAFTFTSAEDALDNANRDAALKSLTEQARSPLPMRTARESAQRAIARSFALPLRAAGVDANVEVRFADQPRDEPAFMDGSRPLDEVMGRPVEVKR